MLSDKIMSSYIYVYKHISFIAKKLIKHSVYYSVTYI